MAIFSESIGFGHKELPLCPLRGRQVFRRRVLCSSDGQRLRPRQVALPVELHRTLAPFFHLFPVRMGGTRTGEKVRRAEEGGGGRRGVTEGGASE